MFALFLIIATALGALRGQVRKQRDLMQEIQRRVLPETLPRNPRLDVATRWIPHWTVAGDYYDIIDLGSGHVALCLADVSGKGMTAALIMSNVQAIVRIVATDRRLEPDRILRSLNRLLCERLRRGFFVTVFYAVIDTMNGTLSFANAGHPPAMLRRADGSVDRLKSTGPVAGILPAATYRCVDVQLNEGDRLVVYSDGITEYGNRAGEQFGEATLADLLAKSDASTADEMCAAITEALHDYGDGRPFDDDVTMVVCRYHLS